MNGETFVGSGPNPHGPDLPLGFSNLLAQNPEAMAAYGRLSKGQQAALIRKIQSGGTGEEAEFLVAQAIRDLSEHS